MKKRECQARHIGWAWCWVAVIFVIVVGLVIPPSLVRPASAQGVPPHAISLRVQTPNFQLDAQGVRVPDYGRNDTPGAPALPVWSTLVELPPTGAWDIGYEAPGARFLNERVDVAAVQVPDLAPPSPGGWTSVADLPGAVPMVDRPDPTIYGRDAFYPESPVVPGDVQWQRGRRLLALRVFPFQYNPVTRTLRYFPDLQITILVTPGEPAGMPADQLLSDPRDEDIQSAAKTGKNPAAVTGSALRIRTSARGLYRLTYNDLLTAGVPLASTDPATFDMSYLGQSISIEVTGDGDTSFEPGELVIFYAEPYQGRYQANNVYWFTYGGASGMRMDSRSVTPTGSEPLVTTITQTLHVEFDREYRTTFPRPRDADHWFDTPLSPDIATGILTATRSYDLALDDALTSGNVLLRATLHGGADRPANPDKSIAIRLNNHPLGTHQWEGLTYTTATTTAPATWLDGSPNRVSLVAAISQLPGIEFYSVSPDWVELSYPALADAEGDRIYVAAMTAGANKVNISGFTTANVQVYDLRAPRHPVRLLTTATTKVGASYTLSFWDANLPGPTYFLSTETALLTPLAIEPDTPSDWRTPGHSADYIAIVHSSLWVAINPLLNHRTAEGLQVAKVDVQDIYDEWSFGRRDPEAIRNFLDYAYHHWNGAGRMTELAENQSIAMTTPPRYVLLVGEGHYDFTGVSGTSVPNLIPPYLIDIDPWFGETAADNRYVSVDSPNDYLPDMAIGRIPARTPADVTAVVNKIIAYETVAQVGDWQKRAVFVADTNVDPAGNFHAYSDEIRLHWLPASYDDSTIYYNRDYFTGAAMRTAIKTAFNNDALMLQWFGHGSVVRWGSVNMFSILDPGSLNANDAWPFTASYTCYTGYFIYLASGFQSLAEALVLSPQRGSIADFSSSGAHIGDSLLVLDQGLTQAIFSQRIERVGEAVDAARLHYFGHSASFHDVIDTYILFGDPALKLRLPAPPLAVDLSTFNSEAQDDRVLVTWETASEHDNIGFSLYRSQTSDQLGELLAFVPSQTPGSGQGAVYEYSDSAVTLGRTYWYTLEAMDANGGTTRHGPVSVDFAAPTAVTLSGVHASSATSPVIPLVGTLLALLTPLAGALAVRRRRA